MADNIIKAFSFSFSFYDLIEVVLMVSLITVLVYDCLQRFSELCENLRVSSHQILTSELTVWKPRLRNHCSLCNNISTCTSKHPPLYVTGDSLSQVRFLTCQFYQSKFDVTRPCNFHKVLKTSVQLQYFESFLCVARHLADNVIVLCYLLCVGLKRNLSFFSCLKNNKKRSHTQLDSRKQVIAFQDRVITINIKEAQHPLK